MDINISNIEHIIWWRLFVFAGLIVSGLSIWSADSITIVNPAYLIGIGIGMFLVGISFWIADTKSFWFDGIRYWQNQTPVHTWFTRLILWVGIILLVLSLFPLIISIIYNQLVAIIQTNK
jgi:hypothetical protein